MPPQKPQPPKSQEEEVVETIEQEVSEPVELTIWEETGFGTDQMMVSAYNLETGNDYTIDDYQKNSSLGPTIDQWALEQSAAGNVDALTGTVDVFGIEDEALSSTVANWDIDRNLAMEGMVLFTEDYGDGGRDHEDSKYAYHALLGPLGIFTGGIHAGIDAAFGGDSAFEKYVDANDLEEFGYKDHVSTGMTFEEFAKEWTAANPDKAPTQKDYENWILWGDPGKLYADAHGAEHNVDLGKKLNSLGLDGSAYEGVIVDIYTEESLQYLKENGLEFDFLADGQTAIIHGDVDLANSRYKQRGELMTGWTMVTKVQENEWYEEEWVMYTAMAASIVAGVFTGGLATAAYGAAAGAAGGGFLGATAGTLASAGVMAASGAVTTGLITETAGGDFEDGAEKGAISGAITGASMGVVNTLIPSESLYVDDAGKLVGNPDAAFSDALVAPGAIEQGGTTHALVSAGLGAAGNYAQGGDLESALISGASAGVGTTIPPDKWYLDAALSLAGSAASGEKTESALVRAGAGAAKYFIAKQPSPAEKVVGSIVSANKENK